MEGSQEGGGTARWRVGGGCQRCETSGGVARQGAPTLGSVPEARSHLYPWRLSSSIQTFKLLTLSRFSCPPLILALTAYRLWKDSGKLTSAPHSLLGSSPLSASFRRRVVRGIGFHRRLESLTAGWVPVTRTAAVAPAVPPPQRPSTRPIEAAKHYRSRRASSFRNNRI